MASSSTGVDRTVGVTIEGVVFDIQRFCIHDGPGIRTTVFLKGCPLDCGWCHNPESKRFEPELFYTPSLCIGCGACGEVCPSGAQVVVDGLHVLRRPLCTTCLRCVSACPAGALESAGSTMTVEQVILEVEKDRVFYEHSGGGMTLSGGEPLAQFAFTRDLLGAAREHGLGTCVETCGHAASERVLDLVPLVDLFLWDLKDTDPERHRRNTAGDLSVVMRSLSAADAAGARTILRCVLIDGLNLDEPHLADIGQTAARLKHCEGVELLPYHALGTSKLERLGLPVPTRDAPQAGVPSGEAMEAARQYLRERGVAVFGP